MTRRKKIKEELERLDQQYQPSDNFKKQIHAMMQGTISTYVSDDDFDKIINLVEQTYQRNHKSKQKYEPSDEDLPKTDKNAGVLQQIVESGALEVKGIKEGLTKINADFERLDKYQQQQNDALDLATYLFKKDGTPEN